MKPMPFLRFPDRFLSIWLMALGVWISSFASARVGSSSPIIHFPSISAQPVSVIVDSSIVGSSSLLENSTLPLLEDREPWPDLFPMRQRQQWGEITRASLPLMTGAFLIGPVKYEFRDLRNDLFAPGRVNPFDDYLQYAPAAVMLGLKAAGYQGRSSWGRMLVADAFSVAVMAILVNSIKYSAGVMRPDGSTRNSFPSGHTATAFMTATMLHKEYGQTRSPWFSVGAYTAASVTGLMRVINNRHWVSDVLMGAGLGIFSTELGYYLAGLIFKDKGLRQPLLPTRGLKNPSFVRLDMGVNLIPGRYRLDRNTLYTFDPGAYMGLEGAWFMHPHFGFGAGVALHDLPVRINSAEVVWDESGDGTGTVAGPGARSEAYKAHLSGHFSYDLHPRIQFCSQLHLGYSFTNVDLAPGTNVDLALADNFPRLSKGRSHGLDFGIGAALAYRAGQHLGFSLRCDYSCWNPALLVTSSADKFWLQTLTPSGSVVIYF